MTTAGKAQVALDARIAADQRLYSNRLPLVPEHVPSPESDAPTERLDSPTVLNHKQPGKHGIWLVGDEQEPGTFPESEHVVRVKAGDAVVFYNYEYTNDDAYNNNSHNKKKLGDDRIISWRSFHCGLPSPSTKWIATNWLTAIEPGDEEREN